MNSNEMTLKHAALTSIIHSGGENVITLVIMLLNGAVSTPEFIQCQMKCGDDHES